MKKLLAIVSFAGILPLGAIAQDASPAPAVEAIPPPNCTKPKLGGYKARMGDADSDEQAKINAYQACMTQYSNVQKAISQAHLKAANDAIKDFNDFVKEYNDSKGQ